MDKGTIIRTVALGLTWLNVALSNYGLEVIPVVSHEEIALGLTFVASIWGWFKNNYITVTGKKQRVELKRKGLAK